MTQEVNKETNIETVVGCRAAVDVAIRNLRGELEKSDETISGLCWKVRGTVGGCTNRVQSGDVDRMMDCGMSQEKVNEYFVGNQDNLVDLPLCVATFPGSNLPRVGLCPVEIIFSLYPDWRKKQNFVPLKVK
jgi:hypothetical protein